MTLAWTKAVAVRGMQITREEDAAGWPATWPIHRLAKLQSPDDAKLREVLFRALSKDCESGALASVRTILPPGPTIKRTRTERGRWGSEDWNSRDFLGVTITVRPLTEKISLGPPAARAVYSVAPEAFLDWLKANKQMPSEHISAWVEARRTPVICPPKGWEVQSKYGLLRCDATPDGRLVSLADLVQWLMKEKELPIAAAVERVCEALGTNGAGDWLYLLDESGYAKQLLPSHSFAYSPAQSFWETPTSPEHDDCGIDGVTKHMRRYWAKSPAPGSDDVGGQQALEPVAIRINKAHELWGYGRPVEDAQGVESTDGGEKDTEVPATYVLPQALRDRVKGSRWTDAEKKALKDAINKAGPGGAAAAARELGLSQARISELISNTGKDLRPSVWSALASTSKRA